MMFRASQCMRVEILFPQKRGPAVQPFMPNTMVLKRPVASDDSKHLVIREKYILLFNSTVRTKSRGSGEMHHECWFNMCQIQQNFHVIEQQRHSPKTRAQSFRSLQLAAIIGFAPPLHSLLRDGARCRGRGRKA